MTTKKINTAAVAVRDHNDNSALESLISALMPLLASIHGRSEEIASDITIGIWEACRCYDEDYGDFLPFCKTVVKNIIAEAYKIEHARKSTLVLREATRFSTSACYLHLTDDADDPFCPFISSDSIQSSDDRDEFRVLMAELIPVLSPLERQVLVLYGQLIAGGNTKLFAHIRVGLSRQGIERTEKQIDNTLQRIRAKARDVAEKRLAEK